MNTKKLVSMILALVMMLAMATSAMAAKITIDDGTITDATYVAYKLLNATDGGNEKLAYTVNPKYRAVLLTALNLEDVADDPTTEEDETVIVTDPEIVNAIAATTNIADLANDIYAKILNAKLAVDETAVDNVFDDVEQGYYLIVETELGETENGATDTYSRVMLDTAGLDEITVETKEDVPTVEKKVEEKNDSTGESSWGDSADYDIGDVINYTITGTVSDEYTHYKSYYYSFSDTMDAGLTYNEGTKVYVVNGDSKVEVTDQFDIVETDNGFTATANLKELTGVTITGTTTIVVEYTATLNDNAVSGSTGNKNEVVLEYENDPRHEADGDPETPDKPDEPGKTPEDVNVVFTFDAIVNKVDTEGKKLEGAGFTLYKWDAAKNNWVAVGKEITGKTTFNFEGLDVGQYKLVETTVPAGYNKADDIEFSIEAVYDKDEDPDELTGLVVKDAEGNVISAAEGVDDPMFTTTVVTGEVETDVVNVAGVELPETGAQGTKMIYMVGGILVAAAAILLITKRRMNAAE